MTTTRPQTNVEAQQRIVAQQDAIRPLLRKALQTNDKPSIDKYMGEMERLNRQMQATATVTVGGVDVPIGAIGSGIQSGISGLFTAIPDIATAGYNYLAPQGMQVPSLGELGTKYLGIQNEPQSQEQAYAFRIAQGAGSAAIPSAGTKGLLLGTGLGAGDVAVSQATGLPEGIASGGYAIANLTRAGFKGVQSFRESRKLNKFIEENIPTEGQNVFKEFMFRGQGSDSPIVAAALQKLRSQPQYAELFAKFDQAASDFALSNVTKINQATGKQIQVPLVSSTQVTSKQEATEAVATRVQRELEGLKDKRSEAASSIFEQAKGYGADKPLVEPTITIKNIDDLIGRYSAKSTPNADKAVEVLNSIKGRLTSTNPLNPEQAMFVGAIGPLQTTTKRNIDQVQGVLSEFGKKASTGDSLIKDLAISDEKIISAAIFRGMKDDVNNALKTASGSEITALKLLNLGRNTVKKASDNYLDAILQGMPSFLKDKPLSAVSYEDLYANYKDLNEYQRAKVRSYVGSTDQEALNFLDKNIFQDFVKSAQGKNNADVLTTDLEKLATNWKSLGDNEKFALTTALGANAKEFDQRMTDALVFTRKMRVSQPATEAEKTISPDLQRGISAVAGTAGGYASAKGTDVAMTTINELFKKQGLTDEQLMKMLLTPEGANFLRQGSLTGASANTLDALTKIPSTLETTAPALSAITRLTAPNQEQAPAAAIQAAPEGVYVPEDIFGNQQSMQTGVPSATPAASQPSEGGVFVPEDIFTSSPATTPRVNVNANKDERQGIFNQELNSLLQKSNAVQASGDQAAIQRVTGDISALLREAQRNNLQLSVQ
jgi:hypothetical protein